MNLLLPYNLKNDRIKFKKDSTYFSSVYTTHLGDFNGRTFVIRGFHGRLSDGEGYGLSHYGAGARFFHNRHGGKCRHWARYFVPVMG